MSSIDGSANNNWYVVFRLPDGSVEERNVWDEIPEGWTMKEYEDSLIAQGYEIIDSYGIDEG